MPSLPSSPTMRGEPHVGLDCHISWMNGQAYPSGSHVASNLGTVIAWQKKRFRDYWRRLRQSGKPGRPATSQEVLDLIQDMWRSNST
jgi:hypothetical protein